MSHVMTDTMVSACWRRPRVTGSEIQDETYRCHPDIVSIRNIKPLIFSAQAQRAIGIPAGTEA
jgi:hypothetical protein